MEIPIHKYNPLTGTLKTQTTGVISSQRTADKDDSNSMRGDSATLSMDAKILTARASVARIAFAEGEKAAGRPTQEMLQEAGKQAALEFLHRPAELTPENIAIHTVAGIVGYISKAFQLNNPHATKENLSQFHETLLNEFQTRLTEFRKEFTDENALNLIIMSNLRTIEEVILEQIHPYFKKALDQFNA